MALSRGLPLACFNPLPRWGGQHLTWRHGNLPQGLPGGPGLAFFTGVSLGAEEQVFQVARGGR